MSREGSGFESGLRERFEELFFCARVVLVSSFLVTVPLWFFGFSPSSGLEWFFTLVAVIFTVPLGIVWLSLSGTYLSYKEWWRWLSMKTNILLMSLFGGFNLLLLILQRVSVTGLGNLAVGAAFFVPAVVMRFAVRVLRLAYKICDEVQESELDEHDQPNGAKKYTIVTGLLFFLYLVPVMIISMG